MKKTNIPLISFTKSVNGSNGMYFYYKYYYILDVINSSISLSYSFSLFLTASTKVGSTAPFLGAKKYKIKKYTLKKARIKCKPIRIQYSAMVIT
jgi:hypothetical protein